MTFLNKIQNIFSKLATWVAVLAIVLPVNLLPSTIFASTAPPVLVSPPNNATINDTTPTFTIAPFPGDPSDHVATQWQIDTDTNFFPAEIESGFDPVNKTSYTVKDAQALSDGTYYVRVRFIETGGNISDYSAITAFTIDTVNPIITALNVDTLTATSARVTWTTNEPTSSQVSYGLTSFYGTDTPEIDQTSPVISHQVVLTDLTCNTKYFYKATSKDPAGNTISQPVQPGANEFTTAVCPVVVPNESSPSASGNISNEDKTAPQAPNNFKATPGDGKVTLIWDAVSDAAHYKVRFRDLSKDQTVPEYAYIDMADLSTTLEIATLRNGVKYEFSIDAIDAAGNEGPYAIITARPVKSKIVAAQTEVVSTQAPSHVSASTFQDLSSTGTSAPIITPPVTENVSETPSSQPQDQPGDQGKIKGQETQTASSRTALTFGILLLALAAGVGGYYGYEWWLSRRELESAGPVMTDKKSNGTNSKVKTTVRRKNGRW